MFDEVCSGAAGQQGVWCSVTSSPFSVGLYCHLTNQIISSEFMPLLSLPLQSLSLCITLCTFISLFLSLSFSPCSQHQDLKQHG